MVARLNDIPGIICLTPKGAIYGFPNITGTGLTSGEFAKLVLEKAGVAVLTLFDNSFSEYILGSSHE